jgi:RND family efflux transporter MFP subunit
MANEDLSQLKIDKSGAGLSRGGRKKAVYISLVFLCIIILATVFLRGMLLPAVEVEVTTAGQIYPSQALTLLNASGYVVAQRKAAVASKVTGRLISISVEEGDAVKSGDVIARLESEDVAATQKQASANLEASRAELESAKAELQDAITNLERQKELVAKDFVSRIEYDTANARYKKASAAVASSEAAIRAFAAALHGADVAVGYTYIRAPFDAVVLTKDADVGDIVTPIGAAAEAKAAVVTIADMNSLLVEADVSESNLKQVKAGEPCEIQLDAFPDLRFRGQVHMIVPTADRTKATVMVKVKFLDKDKRVLPEMSAKVAFLERPMKPEELKPRIAVNASSVVTQDSRKYVFLVKGDSAIETPVKTGEQFGEMVEVLDGVKAGDRVILKPADKVRNNTRIKTAEK